MCAICATVMVIYIKGVGNIDRCDQFHQNFINSFFANIRSAKK
jgi:hypothetical protein